MARQGESPGHPASPPQAILLQHICRPIISFVRCLFALVELVVLVQALLVMLVQVLV